MCALEIYPNDFRHWLTSSLFDTKKQMVFYQIDVKSWAPPIECDACPIGCISGNISWPKINFQNVPCFIDLNVVIMSINKQSEYTILYKSN